MYICPPTLSKSLLAPTSISSATLTAVDLLAPRASISREPRALLCSLRLSLRIPLRKVERRRHTARKRQSCWTRKTCGRSIPLVGFGLGWLVWIRFWVSFLVLERWWCDPRGPWEAGRRSIPLVGFSLVFGLGLVVVPFFEGNLGLSISPYYIKRRWHNSSRAWEACRRAYWVFGLGLGLGLGLGSVITGRSGEGGGEKESHG